jgi:FixJ family two-component response regulator
MKGSRRLLESGGEDRSGLLRDALDKAGDQALRAGQIIRRLREFVGRGDSELRVESIKRLIEEASALALVGTKDQGIRVRFQFDPAVDLVLVDKVQIQQVLLNLLRNAVEAMEASQRRELVISTAAGDGDMVAVSVADTGSGIAPELMSQLFQPFVTNKRHGMGVGLSICRTIVEAQADRSRWSPVPPAERSFGSPYGPRAGRISAMPPDRSIVHVIDDDEAVRQALAFQLGSAGIEVRTYESAVAFLEVAPTVHTGCIITDMRVPELSGIDLLRRLRELRHAMPVIVITARGDIPLAVEAMRLGAIDFLEKSFEDEVLLASVRSALDKGDRDQKRGRSATRSRSASRRCRTASAMSSRDWWPGMPTSRLTTTSGSALERSRPTGPIS